jgi:carbohydrate diacid regulator
VNIDRQLAQSIVDRSMQIIDCNINIMDARGVIIASGDPARVGETHQGALLVLSRQKVIEIDEAFAPKLDGVRPGVNLPLRAGDEVVGCIGLTGDPAEVARFAELVRLAAETMLEQARLADLVARDARMREEFVLALVRGEALDPARLEWATRSGLDPALPRVAVVIEVDDGGLEREALLVELQRLHTLVSTPQRGNLVATLSLAEIVVLMPVVADRRRQVEDLARRLRGRSPLGFRIALGRAFEGTDGVARSYRVAAATLAVGKRGGSEAEVFVYDDLRLPVLVASLGDGWQREELAEPARRLAAADRKGELARTLGAWFDNGMQHARTALALGIHRNTLDYRMKRIAEICGLDLGATGDLMLLYLALQVDETR